MVAETTKSLIATLSGLKDEIINHGFEIRSENRKETLPS
jgi:hypothetical protein